jgi:tetratricopeptide (TPR) repeat protein
MQMQRLHKKMLRSVSRQKKRGFTLLLMLMAVLSSPAQTEKKVEKKAQPAKSVSLSADRLTDALEQNASDETLAADYINLAKDLSGKKDYPRAEDYLNRALVLCLKLKRKDLSSSTYRELAKVQEAQGKFEDAAVNYRNASRLATDDVQKALNENDANRLKEIGRASCRERVFTLV